MSQTLLGKERNENKIYINSISDEIFSESSELLFYSEDLFNSYFKKNKKFIRSKLVAENGTNYTEESFIQEYQKQIEESIYNIDFYKIQCPVCSNFYKILRKDHIEKHNLDKNYFIQNYGGLSPIDIIINKTIQLYNFNIFKFREQQENGTYIHKEYNTEITLDNGNKIYLKEMLNENKLRQHFKFKTNISIFPVSIKNKLRARYLIFDVDTENAKEDTKKLVTILKMFFNAEDIHIIYSGRKGYHITLYFNVDITLNQINIIGKQIKRFAGLDTPKIEVRPTSNNSIKLPLGIHKVTNNLCLYVDKNFNIIKDQFNYYLNIKRIDVLPIIKDIIQSEIIFVENNSNKEENTSAKNDKKVKNSKSVNLTISQTVDDINNSCEYIYKYGLKELGTRNNYHFKLALWMKDILEYDKITATEKLKNWLVNQSLNGKLHSLDDALKKNKSILDSVYDTDKYTISLKTSNISISKEEFWRIKKFKNKYVRLIYFTFIVLGKVYQSSIFYLSVRRLHKLTGFSTNTISKYLNKLISSKHLEVIYEGKFNEYEGNEATTYHVPLLDMKFKSTIVENITIIDDIKIKDIYNQLNIKFK